MQILHAIPERTVRWLTIYVKYGETSQWRKS